MTERRGRTSWPWGPLEPLERTPWPLRSGAPLDGSDYPAVCYVQDDADGREVHTVAADENLDAARELVRDRLAARAAEVGEFLSEGVVVVHREAWGPGEHIVTAKATALR